MGAANMFPRMRGSGLNTGVSHLLNCHRTQYVRRFLRMWFVYGANDDSVGRQHEVASTHMYNNIVVRKNMLAAQLAQ